MIFSTLRKSTTFLRHLLPAWLLIMAATPAAHAQLNTSNDDLWAAVNSGLYGLVKGSGYGEGHYLQQIAFPAPAAWADKDGEFSLYLVANNVPVWEPTWTFTARRLDDAYGIFINAIDVKGNLTAQEKRALEAAEVRWKRSRERYDQEIQRVEARWQRASTNDPTLNRDDWMRHNSASAVVFRNQTHRDFIDYNGRIPSDYRVVADLLERYELEGTDLTRQLVVFPNTPADAVAQDKQNWPSVRMHAFIGSASLLATMIKNADEHASDPGWQKPGFSFGTSHAVRDEERLAWGGSASFGGFFVRINVGGNSQDYSLKDTKQEFALSFQALAVAAFAIGPSPAWYSDYLITHYKCGPFKRNPNGRPAIDPQEYFGKNGKLSLIPSSVIVAYKPVVTLTLSRNDFDEVQHHISGAAGISIGPFSIGGGADQVKKHTVIDTDKRTITLNFDYAYPVVLAVISQRINADLSCPPSLQ